MATPYGQFGTPGYFGKDIPPNIINQYPGTQNIQQAGQMYGNLLYGPLSRGYQVAAAQASDPSAQKFQQETTQGDMFGTPGAGSAALGSLFGGGMTGNVAGQQAQQKQQQEATKGMSDVANTYAQNIYGAQSAQLALERAQAEQQQAQQAGIMSLINMFTAPNSMLSNILGPGGTGTLGPGQSAFGGLWQGMGFGGGGAGAAGMGGLTGGLDITDFGSMLGSLGGAGGAAAGSASALGDIASMAPDLLAFA